MDYSSIRQAYGVREFCERYDICRDFFYSEVRAGRLRAVRVGKRKTVVLKKDAEAWASALPEISLPELSPGVREPAEL